MIQLEKNTMTSVRGKSCRVNPLSSLERVSESTDCSGAVDAACLCFQKGFDKVPLKRILNK